MKMFLKNSLCRALAGLIVLTLAACSQRPDKTPELVTPVPGQNPAGQETPGGKPQNSGKKPGKVDKPATLKPVVMGPFVPLAPGKRISHVSVPGPYVAVTFDDGPHAVFTPQVLDIFNRHGAHATFFVLGQNANRHRGILARAVAEGHEVGAHTWSHINMCASGWEKSSSELDRTNAVIESATGRAPKVMRPPYGAASNELIDLVYGRYGTPAILWDVDTSDWRKPGVQTVINRAVNEARPGSIILLHDIHASTLEAVEGIVTGLQARGFKLVTVSELISIGRNAAGASAPARTEPAGNSAAEPAAPAAPATPEVPLPGGAASSGAAPAAPQPVAEPAAPPAETSAPRQPAAEQEEELDFFDA